MYESTEHEAGADKTAAELLPIDAEPVRHHDNNRLQTRAVVLAERRAIGLNRLPDTSARPRSGK